MRLWPFAERAERAAPPRLEPPPIRNQEISLSDLNSWDDLVGVASAAGPVVNSETAMRSTAVYACVRIISGAIASLPFPVYSVDGDTQEKARDHPAWTLLNKAPNQLMAAGTFREVLLNSVLLRGDSFSIILRSGAGQAREILPVPTASVSPTLQGGRYIYRINDRDFQLVLDQDDVLHIPGVGFNPKTGHSLSPIQYAGRTAIGIQLAADEYSARFYANDATPRGVLQFPGKVTPDLAKQIRERWVERFGGVANSHVPGILELGGVFEPITMSAEDTQLMEARHFQINDIARIFGVPPFLIGSTEKVTSFGTGIEQMSIGFVTYTLKDHLRRIEQEVDRKIIRSDAFRAEFNVNGLLRGDAKTRGQFYRQALGGSSGPGWLTQNDVRRKENEPPIDGGDVLQTFQPAAAGGPGDQPDDPDDATEEANDAQ